MVVQGNKIREILTVSFPGHIHLIKISLCSCNVSIHALIFFNVTNTIYNMHTIILYILKVQYCTAFQCRTHFMSVLFGFSLHVTIPQPTFVQFFFSV